MDSCRWVSRSVILLYTNSRKTLIYRQKKSGSKSKLVAQSSVAEPSLCGFPFPHCPCAEV